MNNNNKQTKRESYWVLIGFIISIDCSIRWIVDLRPKTKNDIFFITKTLWLLSAPWPIYEAGSLWRSDECVTSSTVKEHAIGMRCLGSKDPAVFWRRQLSTVLSYNIYSIFYVNAGYIYVKFKLI